MKWRRYYDFGVPLRPPVSRRMPPPPPEVVEEMIEEAEEESVVFTTRRAYWRGVVWLLISLGLQWLASLMPEFVEQFYSLTIYHYIGRWLAAPGRFVSKIVLAEVSFALLLLWFILWTIWYLRRSIRREARFGHVVKIFFLQILWVFSILVPLFLFLWGFNYQRMPLADTMGLDRRPAARSGELEAIGLQIINGANRSYAAAKAGQEWIGASRMSISKPQLYKVIENAFQAETMLGKTSQGGFSEPKPLYLSKLTSWMGVSGFYIAYTAEVTYNYEIPDVDLPMTIAHHKAHQRGYAREDEANFIAHLICIKSADPYVRYSGYMYALKLIEPLAKADRVRYEDLFSRLDLGPQDDMRARLEFWGSSKNSYLGPLSRGLFNVYLRANRVHGGMKNYDEDVYLLTSYYLKNPNGPTLPGLADGPVDTPTSERQRVRPTEPAPSTDSDIETPRLRPEQ
ncbi:MAG: DUF3810 domain-containing protein [Blastocatellia bacterium]|nr:DUF3810 domain-containing protein [Blastocatellia bacterium]